ncbi:MAG: DUF59 domain-containing protein, partial [Cyanobacteria bacterium Co-bin13]|nr:DUF59 domain-containing protein [Cyanobacteria bacterium Co-bin13]
MVNHTSPFQLNHPPSAPEAAPPSAEDQARHAEAVYQLKQVQEPTLGNDLVSLGRVRNLRIVGDYVYLRLYVGSHELALQDQVQAALSQLPWCKKAYVQICTIPKVRT